MNISMILPAINAMLNNKSSLSKLRGPVRAMKIEGHSHQVATVGLSSHHRFVSSYYGYVTLTDHRHKNWIMLQALPELILMRHVSTRTTCNMSKVWLSKLFALCDATKTCSSIVAAINFHSDQCNHFSTKYNLWQIHASLAIFFPPC